MRVYKSTISNLFIGLIFTLVSASVSNAAAITVNSIGDAAATDGQCTLREAISNAQTNSDATGGDCAAGAGDDTINFSLSGTILLGSTLPTITIAGGALTIDGTGRSVIIDGQNAVRVMDVGGNVSLSNLAIANGNSGGSEGGGVRNLNGTLAVTDCTFSGNNGSSGGGIFGTGTLTVAGSTFSDNTASYGAGVQITFGSLAITNSSFTGNTASQFGGGVVNDNSSTNITGSTFATNTAGARGGAVYGGNSPVNISDSILSGNHAPRGGAISAGYVANVANSTLSGNTADLGGAIYGNADEGNPFVSVRNSTLSGNSATNAGGALFLIFGVNFITNSTFSNNSAPSGGGLYGDAAGPSSSINNSTFSNSAIVSPFAGFGYPFPMYNTIVAGGGTCAGVTDGGYNIDSGTGCGFTAATSRSNTDPRLGPLHDNGGSTKTFALLPGSPAIDYISVGESGCGAVGQTDQRGIARPFGAKCDIGAFELADSDGDGVLDNTDICPGTSLASFADRPDRPKKNRFFAMGDGRFVDGDGTFSGFTVADTRGCSGKQIIQVTGIGDGHDKFGIPRGVILDWIAAMQ